MKFTKILGGVAVAMGVAFAGASAHAIVLTGEATNAQIENENGTVVGDTNPLTLVGNPALLILNPIPASFNFDVSVADDGTETGFSATQQFTNNSGADLVFGAATQLLANDFDGADFEYSLDGTNYTSFGPFTALGPFEVVSGFVSVANGADFWIRASATDVNSSGNYDFTISAVPLPAGLLLLLSGLGGLGLVGWRRRQLTAAA